MTPTLPLLAAYASIVLVHAWLQEQFRRRNASITVGTWKERPPGIWERLPSVDVVIPTYNEDPNILDACFESLDRQDYTGELRFLVVDDGSSNIEALLPVYRKYQNRPNWHVLRWRSSENQGKRQAQHVAIYGADSATVTRLRPKDPERRHGWRGSTAEFIVMVDSDTVIEPDGISRILTPFLDDKVAAVSGDVAILNQATNRLTKLINERYRLLFHHERAAQSYFGMVFCCAGPFSAYRLQSLNQVWQRYVATKFGKSICTFGDDLQLTNLMLQGGYRSIFQPEAKAFTTAPTSLRAYVRQQWRWNRSSYRQFRWVLPVLRRNRNAYQAFDLVARTAPTLLLAVAMTMSLLDLMMLGTARLAQDLVAVGGMLLTGFSAVLLQTRKPSFALLYGLVYVALLVPTKLWALCTLHDSRWGTRTWTGGEVGVAALPAE